MLCPNCGTRTKTEHKFCRNCGMNLEPVARALAEHLSAGGAASREAARGSAPEAMGCLLAGVFVILLGVLLTAFLPGSTFKYVGVAAAVTGLIAVLVSALSLPRPTEDAAAAAAAPHEAPGAAAATTGRLLREQTFDPFPASVTDHTTELLEVEAEVRKPRD